MQREKATSAPCGVVVVAGVVEAALGTGGEPLPLPPQPAASSENAATETMEARMTERRKRM
jgi:hypothetical protein